MFLSKHLQRNRSETGPVWIGIVQPTSTLKAVPAYMCHGQVTLLWGAICHPEHRKIICIYTLYIYICMSTIYIYIMYINIIINKYVLTYIIPIDGWMTLPQQLGNVTVLTKALVEQHATLRWRSVPLELWTNYMWTTSDAVYTSGLTTCKCFPQTSSEFGLTTKKRPSWCDHLDVTLKVHKKSTSDATFVGIQKQIPMEK